MPEGDSAYRAAHHLAQSLAGREVTEFSLRVPAHATADLRGERIRGADARGKHVLLRVGEYTVHSHFGMDGSWRLVRPGESGRTSWPARHRLRAVIGTDAVVALGIDLAKLTLWRTRDEADKLGWLGPDLLAEAPDLAEAARRIRAEPARPLTAALLDQGNVAGLGNEYVTELLFLRAIRPDRHVGDTADLDALLKHARDLMLENRDRAERTFTGDPRPGQRSYVFGRAGRACRRCGTIILEGTHASGQRDGGTRRAAWCPRCQAF